ncbi:POZ domain-containing protein [Fomitopsis serialis]|uniref:POZ domain-containing protein n=1 Tax=Fomitopsis serialis TaxID=139415 RepID=UPI0020078CBF|nr:POZ domain-containing protein [Neoantrodia serialis]XP_047893345.1 POZ domain-containing protein [Neoantrodia serialis]KAH9914428.1 POZ domain-containing protein [Neoantrodia serialis]KAH9925970.1 POZ domain-containing protein [Neoantrodia serialis]
MAAQGTAAASASDKDWVKLVSTDGYTFLIPRKVAMNSGTLKNMLSEESNFAEAATNTCMIEERGIIVEKLCEYLSYKTLYQDSPPKEIPDFQERLQPEIALDLLMAADYYEA